MASDREAAEIAVQQVGDWAKWMAGIQTAAIGGLAAVLLDKDNCPVPLADAQRLSALAAFLFLSVALLFSAWVLSAVASISLRLGSVGATDTPTSTDFDFYNWPSFTWLGGRSVTFGLLMGIPLWSWALGLASLATFGLLHFG